MELDHLTGFLPLHIFLKDAQKILIENPQKRYAIIATDLSNFKYINDFYSEEEGDWVIKEFARNLYITRPDFILGSRPYADQFRIMLEVDEDISLKEFANDIAARNADFVRKIQPRFPNVFLYIFAGAYIIDDPNESLRSACDKAHFAKKCIKGNYTINCGLFDPFAYEDSSRISQAVNSFQKAKKYNRIMAHFQPKIDASTGEVIGAEALGRMYGIGGELMYPDDFVPALEKTGLITEFDDIIFDLTFQTLHNWIMEGKRVVPVSINLSRMHFLKAGLVDKIVTLQQKYDIPPSLIMIEITETTFVDSKVHINEIVEELRSMGFKVAVDDFGSGQSSLSLISSLKADTIKLDRKFAIKCLNTEHGKTILGSIINMLKAIGFDIICEGIENEEDKNIMIDLGCTKIQGFLFDKPLEEEEFKMKYL